MGSITDFIASFNWIDRVEGVISTFINADWKSARQSGAAGLAGEFGSSVTGQNRWRLEVPRDCGWSGAEIERFLRRLPGLGENGVQAVRNCHRDIGAVNQVEARATVR